MAELMLWLGIDDTDVPDSPGTNKLALYLADAFSDDFPVEIIVRHQLLIDPRILYTSQNGCASLRINAPAERAAELADRLCPIIGDWSPAGSDPGLCVAAAVAPSVVDFARRCQTDVVTQQETFEVAAANGCRLEPLGGTGDGVIGALAAVGLLATQNDGRIIHAGCGLPSWTDMTGIHSVADVLRAGVAEICCVDSGQRVEFGTVALAKRLRPNLRRGRAVLFVTRTADVEPGDADWRAVKVM